MKKKSIEKNIGPFVVSCSSFCQYNYLYVNMLNTPEKVELMTTDTPSYQMFEDNVSTMGIGNNM